MSIPEISKLKELYTEQVAYVASHGDVGANMAYLESKMTFDVTLRREIEIINRFEQYIHGRILEWGCQHGLDSCVYRMRFNGAVELYSCDVVEEDAYKPFHGFSGTVYKKINHPYLLDYPDNYFDVVTSNGVLEHVPDDFNSAREIHRILKPGGRFVVTCLPNKYSYTEAVQRLLKHMAHERLYSMREASSMLQDAGFRLIATNYFFMMPTMLNGFSRGIREAYRKAGRLIWMANDILERAWPINRLASNLLLVAEKT